MFKTKLQSGFTLIELLIVIGIIGILSAIVLVALSESREKGRNSARVSQLNEYRKALELYYSDNGNYPYWGGNPNGEMCLGDYDDNRCWANGTGIAERNLEAELTPEYMPRIHPGENIVFGSEGNITFEGMVYGFENFGSSYYFKYYMEGENQDCGLSDAVQQDGGNGDTSCKFTHSL